MTERNDNSSQRIAVSFCSLLFSLFPLLSNCRFQIREKSEQRKEAVSALRMIGISQAAQSGISPEMPLSHPCRIASGMMQILS